MAFQGKLPELSLTILKTVKNELNSLLNIENKLVAGYIFYCYACLSQSI
jgi:hypothetical protein